MESSLTNLRPEGFYVAAAVSREDGRAIIVSLPHDADGIVRSPDLIALRATNTAAITISNARLSTENVIVFEAQTWLQKVRPAFFGLQCGMSIGLARRALGEAGSAVGAGRHILKRPIADLVSSLADQESALLDGLSAGRFVGEPAALAEPCAAQDGACGQGGRILDGRSRCMNAIAPALDAGE